MAPVVQEAEIQFAQRLASNEKPVRSRALKKLRKYLSVRSQLASGGFTGDELLKIWKGLFYCLWMQDKPLLQEELCAHISQLIHSLQNLDLQFLFLETFLQTVSREWSGIDGLRMDKFYMLVRFVLRQVLEVLKRRSWESSLVQRFTDTLSAQVLHSSIAAPPGVQFHLLDIYLAELARVGAAQLTAEQNLVFIDPFCRTAAKTKSSALLRAISNSLFQEIVDQAPFAIEDLIREVKATGGSDDEDSGQVSGDEETEPEPEKQSRGRFNGVQDEEDDEVLDLGDFDPQEDEQGVGPVLQFDYKAVADRLFELASKSNTPAFNRKKLYKVIETFQNLSNGVFPQDEYPEDISTDEDDDYFGSRKRLKKRRRNKPEDDGDDMPAKKKGKGKKKKVCENPADLNKDPMTEETGLCTTPSDGGAKRKKRKKKNKHLDQVTGEEGEGAKDLPENSAVPESEGNRPSRTENAKEGLKDASEVGDQKKKQRRRQKKKNLLAKTSQDIKVATVPESEDNKTIRSVTENGDDAPIETSKVCQQKKNQKRRNINRSDNTEGGEDALGRNKPELKAAASGEPKDNKTTTSGTEKDGNILTESKDGDQKRLKKRKKKSVSTEAGEESSGVQASIASAEPEAQTCREREKVLTDTPTAHIRSKKKVKIPRQVETPVEEGAGETLSVKTRKMKREMKALENNIHVKGNVEEVNHKKAKTAPVEQEEAIFTLNVTKKARNATGKKSASDFVTFQASSIPKPLYCKRSKRGRPSTPTHGKQLSWTPRSDSKKVTFGLKNNKTTEFKKTDRSLLVSPVGSSRVPFDPQQKPRFGVLKSSPLALPIRPRAADFF